jgi:hypothetical protein
MPWVSYQIAQVYAYRGEPDKAFEWLDRPYKQRDPRIREVTNGRCSRVWSKIRDLPDS